METKVSLSNGKPKPPLNIGIVVESVSTSKGKPKPPLVCGILVEKVSLSRGKPKPPLKVTDIMGHHKQCSLTHEPYMLQLNA